MDSLIGQLKKRRLRLGLKQHDMVLRVGMSRQQYQRLESKGNPRLDTLELVAKGLRGEFMFIPQEKLSAIQALLDSDQVVFPSSSGGSANQGGAQSLSDDPWGNILGEDE